MAKRIFLFLLVNFLIMGTIMAVVNFLGLRPYINQYGMDYEALAAFCLVWGMVGSFVSLQLSRWMAKTMMGVQLVDPHTHDPLLQKYVQSVTNLSRAAGLPTPEIGVYQSDEVNAFATGPSKSRSLVAVSTGLLNRMNWDQVEGVLGHEVAHIKNGDMVTLALIQGVVNAFVMFLAKAIAFAVAQASRDRDEGEGFSYMTYWLVEMLFYMVFSLFGAMVVAWFSRFREFRADAGSARLGGREKMISALQALQNMHELVDPKTEPAVASMKISSRGGIVALLSTHPPLEKRIERLTRMTA